MLNLNCSLYQVDPQTLKGLKINIWDGDSSKLQNIHIYSTIHIYIYSNIDLHIIVSIYSIAVSKLRVSGSSFP